MNADCPQSGAHTVTHDPGELLRCPTCGRPVRIGTDFSYPSHSPPGLTPVPPRPMLT